MENSKRVERGQPLHISARTWNTLTKMAAEYRNRNSFLSGTQKFPTNSIRVQIRNDTGASRSRFDILKITGVVFDYDDNDDEFLNRWVLTGDTPSDKDDSLCVLQGNVDAGRVTTGIVFGVTPASVDVNDAGHEFAKFKDATELDSVSRGPIKILWKQTGTGTKQALVLLGGSSSDGGLFEVAMTQTGGSQGTTTTEPSWTYTVNDVDGNQLETAYDPDADGYWVRHKGQMVAATRGIASYDGSDLKILWCNEQTVFEVCS